MNWWQSECKRGDMIRVSFGSFYHYGIYVSDDEVIQFGLPPAEGLLNRKFEEICVCVTDIDTFSAGKIVEVASLQKGERLKRRSPLKTVSYARSCIGEKGYDILHNNCEHFARYCYLGEKRCEVTEQVADSWNKTSKCYLYFSKIPQNTSVIRVRPAERDEEIMRVSDAQLRLEKYWSWKLLEYALFRSFGYRLADLQFSKCKNGKWICDKCFFSISHSGSYVAVAVSNREVGIDMEEMSALMEKWNDEAVFHRMKAHIVGKKDPVPQTPMELLKLWTQKESLYKCRPKRNFAPLRIQVTEDVSSFRFAHGNAQFLCSIAGSNVKKSFFYYYNGEEASKVKDIAWI